MLCLKPHLADGQGIYASHSVAGLRAMLAMVAQLPGSGRLGRSASVARRCPLCGYACGPGSRQLPVQTPRSFYVTSVCGTLIVIAFAVPQSVTLQRAGREIDMFAPGTTRRHLVMRSGESSTGQWEPGSGPNAYSAIRATADRSRHLHRTANDRNRTSRATQRTACAMTHIK